MDIDGADDQPYTAADEPRLGPGESPRRAGPGDRRKLGMAALALGALGVVFGDIGTSPLYAMQALFALPGDPVRPIEGDVYGAISLVFWSITVIVSIEFVALIMRADNDGEGGIMALIALVATARLRSPRTKAVLIGLGVLGVALFYGDGMITPAISVLSAVEGLEVAAPSLKSLVVPITIALLTGLFAIQRFGTGAIGALFGPVMALWFAAIAILGVGRVAADPAVLRALSPSFAIEFFAAHPAIAFASLGAIVLTLTGVEALYADMGHFGRRPISRAWFFVVFPALTLNYLGQGSLIVGDPAATGSPFFLLIPGWAAVPMVVLATVATIIASQAVISGAFSVTRQAIRLGFLPRLAIHHTSPVAFGQIYAPAVNWALLAAVIVLVVGFGSAAKLASAYGIAVTGTITVDTLLFLVVVHRLWRKPLWVALLGAGVFMTVDLAFLAANLPKVAVGGWFPLTVGVAMYAVLATWRRGTALLTAARMKREGPLEEFVTGLRAIEPPPARVPGTGVYLNARSAMTPLPLRAAVEAGRPIEESVVVLSINTTRAPHVAASERLEIDDLGFEDDGISHVTARFGFQDVPDVPAVLAQARAAGLEVPVDLDDARYFLTHVEIATTGAAGMRRWRKRLFVALARFEASPIAYFRLPPERTVTVGARIEI